MKSLRQRLLGLPAPAEDEVLPAAFYTKHGFGPEDAEELIEQWMELELEEEEAEVSDAALMHAWSILAHLGGKDGCQFLIDELEVSCSIDDEFFIIRFSDLMQAIGPSAVPLLMAVLKSGTNREGFLIEIASTLTDFARQDIERDAVLEAQVEMLRGDPRHRGLKGSIIADLVELTKDRYLPEIRRAFEEKLVDVTINGDFEEVEIKLGLRSERAGPKPHWGDLETELAREALNQRVGSRPTDGDDASIIRYFLALHEGPHSAKSLAEFDGLILGCILAPEMVPPSRFLPSIWDPENLDDDPEWESEEDAQLFLTAVMNWHNGIIRRLDEGHYAPPLTPRSNPRVPTEEETDWARGILSSVMSWHASLTEPTEGHQALMACAFHLIQPDDDTPTRELIRVEHVVRAAHILRESLQSGTEFSSAAAGFGSGETYEREAPKIGRNDPCPCGSGLKYKRCCMN
ncbi:UPF0149 family protein [Haloferula sp.]|uniref:UPF0149 family protein n=1 Tax=Haloferula sp. TaxID=2497595 RepID=UPI003C715F02